MAKTPDGNMVVVMCACGQCSCEQVQGGGVEGLLKEWAVACSRTKVDESDCVFLALVLL